jgi:hypothetical protein
MPRPKRKEKGGWQEVQPQRANGGGLQRRRRRRKRSQRERAGAGRCVCVCVCVSEARHVNPETSPVVRILPAPWGLPGGNWWLPLSDRAVEGPEAPSVTSAGVQETTSLICDHGGEVPRGSGPVGRIAPGGSAEHAGAQTPHELNGGGGRARPPGRQGLRGGEDKEWLFSAESFA